MNNRDHRENIRRAIDIYRDVAIVVTPCEVKVLGMGSNMVKIDDVYLKIGLFLPWKF